MKKFLLTAILLSASVKYGPNGYVNNGSSSNNSSCNGANHCTTSSVNTQAVGNRIEATPGVMLQMVPDEAFGLSVGGGYYQDNTAILNIGIRL